MQNTRSNGAHRGACAVLLAGALAALLSVTGGDALAKKPPKPPPDGGGLANPALTFVAGSKVFVMTADGAHSATLVGGGKYYRKDPTWLPDGSRVAFRLNGEIYTVNPDGTGLTTSQLLDRECSYLIEDRIVLYRKAGDLWVADLDSGATQALGVLGTLPAWEKADTPAATADLDPATPGYQGWIAYVNKRWETSIDPTDPDVHIARLTGIEVGSFAFHASTVQRLPWPTAQNLPEWSADGTTLAFLSDAGYVDAGRELLVVDVDLAATPAFGPPRVLFSDAPGVNVLFRPAVSPDGSWVAFTHRVGAAKLDVERVRADGSGELLELASTINNPQQPHWNPQWTNDLD